MKIAFTICSNNYLAQAKSLGDSIIRYNPDYEFVIGLADRKHDLVDYSPFSQYPIIEIEEIGIENFNEFWRRYNLIELNTASKPFFFQYLFDRSEANTLVVYLDPDILVYSDFSCIDSELIHSPILLTPHILSPIPKDDRQPDENTFLRYGIYNLGFIAIAKNKTSHEFLSWWGERTYSECFWNTNTGVFVDQLWLNLAPIYFPSIKISRNPGLNVAYWNIHERRLSLENDVFYVNEEFPLIFFHFSSFDPTTPELISKNQSRYSIETRPELESILYSYSEILSSNQLALYRDIDCYYAAEQRKLKKIEEERQHVAEKHWEKAGFLAYQRNDLKKARKYLLAAVQNNPSVLRNKGVLSIILESVIGSSNMRKYRLKRNGSRRTPV